MSNKQQYGLILKGKNAPKKNVASVFNDDSSGEDEETKAVVSGGTDWMKRKLTSNAKSGATGLGTKVKAQTKIEMKRALEEDPTVYQYDEVYDQMEAAKTEQATQKKDVDRKPKYITNLLKMAEVRNKDNERRIERQVQKEREAEGDEFADKEKFVTSAYRKKMEELQKLDEEDRKREAIENILDVTKQKDMSGFYRHLYRQTMGEEKGQKDEEETSTSCEDPTVTLTKKSKPSERSYRNRDTSVNEDNDEGQPSQSNSGESDSSDAEDTVAKETEEHQRMEKEKARREELKRQKEKRERRKRRIAEGRNSSSEEEDSDDDAKEDTQMLSEKQKINDKENLPVVKSPPKKEKLDIWKKVTIGDKFEEALQRYLMRKAERGSRFPW